MVVTIISLIGLLVSAGLLVFMQKKHLLTEPVRGADYAWSIFLLLLQLFLTIWSGIGLVAPDPISALVCHGVLVVATACSFGLNTLSKQVGSLLRLPQNTTPLRVCTAIILLLVAGLFATLALEVPSNHEIWGMYPLCFLLEYSLITALMAGLYFLAQRRGGAAGIISIIMLLIGIAEYFIVLFKSMPVVPGDLTALSTAATVAGNGYTYILSAFCLYAIALCAVSIVLCRLSGSLWRAGTSSAPRRRLAINLIVGIICLAGITAHVTLVDYYSTLNITVYTWRPLNSYYTQGFLPAFISGAQTINPHKPNNYSTKKAEDLIASYAQEYDSSDATQQSRTQAEAQFEQEKPTVIAIMNETFSDLSIYQQLHAGYEGPTFFKSLSDCLQRGRLYVSAYGGGTANSEFEFLTGNSMSNFGPGVYPYTIYNMTLTPNLAQQFKELGYTTTAMHPNHPTNWNRENVYQDFGFDQFLSIKDFQGAPTLRGMVEDSATYDKIIDLLQQDSNPQFILDITMQNHSGYHTGLIPTDKQLNLSIDGTSDAEVNEYVSLIQESDRALEKFIGQLRKLDRKVVVVFFGDHQPYFPDTFNDAWFTGEDAATHQERLWQTSYIIWANYDVAGNDQTSQTDDLSTNYLGAELMNLIGAPLNDYQKALLALRPTIPAVNSTGFEDKSLVWHLSNDTADEKTVKARNDYATMQYYEMFRDGKQVFTQHQQSAANETDPNVAPAGQ